MPFEDPFDGPDLGPQWQVMGRGPYAVNGDLEFYTLYGDFADFAPDPNHAFAFTPPPELQQWTAVTRVRFNTPYKPYHQVSLLAFENRDRYVKVDYQRGYPDTEVAVVSNYDNSSFQRDIDGVRFTDYFWLRLDRDGNSYAGYYSADLTTDPDAVHWDFIASIDRPLADPRVVIGGWNSTNHDPVFAEFDHFRIVPEPGSCVLFGVTAAVLLRRVRRMRVTC